MKNGGRKILINIRDLAGAFAEDKDVAKQIRVSMIKPAIDVNKKVVLNFAKVGVATQSFIHAMISEAILNHGAKAVKLMEFRSCNLTVKNVILTVIDYCLEMKQDFNAIATNGGKLKLKSPRQRH